MGQKMLLLLTALVASANAAKTNFVGVDALGNLVLNNTNQKVMANGKEIATRDELKLLSEKLDNLTNLFMAHITPSVSPTASPTTSIPSVSPTISPTESPTGQSSFVLNYNNKDYTDLTDTLTINGSRKVHVMTLRGTGTIVIEAAGSAGGNGIFSGSNNPGAPGGMIRVEYDFKYKDPVKLYAFVAASALTPSTNTRLSGAGGGSTDIRTVYGGSLTSVTDSTFLNSFLQTTSLNSRWVTAGGGGGSHGSTYGYWGYQYSPGAGGPNSACTNTKGGNDGGFSAAGATTTAAGKDGGSSVDARYTKAGVFGAGGIVTSRYGVYTEVKNTWTSIGWPNGGVGTTWANGGGGGGWYGGATNWPNGGGGSNYNTVGTAVQNSCGVNTGAGYLKISFKE